MKTTVSVFNLKQYKEARNPTPRAFELPITRDRTNYKKHRTPNDGDGYKLTTPGDPDDMSASQFSRAWPEGSPDIPTQHDRGFDNDASSYNNETPSDNDPDLPFGESTDSTQYGEGLSGDLGQGLHDDKEPSGEAPLGTHETVQRVLNIDPNEPHDRKTPYGDMGRPFSGNMATPFNQSRRQSLLRRVARNNKEFL